MRYLVVLDTVIVGRFGTLDQAHKAINRRHLKSKLQIRDFDAVDIWNEPGEVEQLNGVEYWRPA